MAQDDGSYFFGLKNRQQDDDATAAAKFLQTPTEQVLFDEDPARTKQQALRQAGLTYQFYGDPNKPESPGLASDAAQYKQNKLSEAWRLLGDADATERNRQDANVVLKQAGLEAVNASDLIGRQIVPGSPEDLSRYATMNTGLSYKMLQDLGMQFPGVDPEKKAFNQYASAGQKQQDVGVFQPNLEQGDVVPRGVVRATPVTTVNGTNAAPTGSKSNVGLTNTIGSEFGEVDNPQNGGYTEPNWNVGAWGDKISGKDTTHVALPVDTLKAFGNPNDANFAKKFNGQYDIQVVNPANGQVAIATLGDKGPGKSTGAGLDMTWGVRQAIGLDQNFKGPIQYRVVPKGSALPDNTVLSDAAAKGGTVAGAAAAGGQQGNAFYISPLDKKDLRDPEIYGAQMTSEDKAKWARHLADDYAGQMDDAGSPLSVTQYKEIYKNFYEGTDKKSVSEKPKEMSADVATQFGGLNGMISQIDALNEAHKLARNKLGLGMLPPIAGVAGVSQEKNDFIGQRDALVGPVSKSLFANVGSLSDTDVKRAQGALPGEWDDEAEANRKTDRAKANILSQMRTVIELQRAMHIDTSGIENMYQRAKAGITKDLNDRTKGETAKQFKANTPNPSNPTNPAAPPPPPAKVQDTWGQSF